MVLTKEYRIPMPVTLEEYRVAQLYMVTKVSLNESGGGNHEGVEVIKNEPYSDETGTGQYTLKCYRFVSRVPSWLRPFLPTSVESMLEVYEESWNAFPYTRTIFRNGWMGDKFKCEIITRYFEDAGGQDNVHHLTPEQLKELTVEVVDVVADPIDAGKYKPEEDPTLYHSKKANRGPWTKDWLKHDPKPVMTSYKLCIVEFKWWGLQTKVEQLIHSMALRNTVLMSHRQCVCWMDEWFGMTMEDIRAYEAHSKVELLRKLGKLPPAEGMATADNNDTTATTTTTATAAEPAAAASPEPAAAESPAAETVAADPPSAADPAEPAAAAAVAVVVAAAAVAVAAAAEVTEAGAAATATAAEDA
eukprot:TRINITY_DN17602_c0_g1_i1.p1 TRINITY_DN17602_c0_g1~~TRINITY_DN17602_c0_g1_i1.p1  ORF type:complete len:373 (-),score=105.89 TRINITY_DN17602_c0_g1_i1:91-1170(-)